MVVQKIRGSMNNYGFFLIDNIIPIIRGPVHENKPCKCTNHVGVCMNCPLIPHIFNPIIDDTRDISKRITNEHPNKGKLLFMKIPEKFGNVGQ